MLDKERKEMLNLLQTEFPLNTTKPFLEIAYKLKLNEQEVIDRIDNLKAEGYIRRIGGIFDSKKLGYYSLLCAIKVPKDKIMEVANFISSYRGVTHNYERNNDYNLWFTVTAASKDEIKSFLEVIKIHTGIKDILELPCLDVFKIKATFHVKE